jgi:hypothetical protein
MVHSYLLIRLTHLKFVFNDEFIVYVVMEIYFIGMAVTYSLNDNVDRERSLGFLQNASDPTSPTIATCVEWLTETLHLGVLPFCL